MLLRSPTFFVMLLGWMVVVGVEDNLLLPGMWREIFLDGLPHWIEARDDVTFNEIAGNHFFEGSLVAIAELHPDDK